MRKVPLTNGGHALVDDEDYERVAHRTWCAWSRYGRGIRYAVTFLTSRKRVYMHRFILGLQAPTKLVDHLNGDGLDNRRKNFRVVGHMENNRNKLGAQSNSATGVRGVSLDPWTNTYKAEIGVARKRINLGRFHTIREAKAARAAGERKYWTDADQTRERLASKKTI